MSQFFAISLAVLALVFAFLWLRQKKQTQEALQEIEHSLKRQKTLLHQEQDRLLNALNDAFILIDGKGLILFANAPATDLVAGRELKGHNIQKVFLDEQITSVIDESLATGEAVVKQIVLPLRLAPAGISEKRGETAWVIDAAPLERKDGRKVSRVVIRDVTTEHQTEQVRKDFVANASHELRTPLSIINGYLENLVDDKIEDPQFVQRSLAVMQKHGERIARIVEDMLVISRLESGEAVTLNLSPFRFFDCVQDVIDRLEAIIQQQKTTIQIEIPDQDLTLIGDRFYWTQVFFNLIENALKQNPSRPLKLKVGGVVNPGENIRLWVTDDGMGIPGGDLPFVFKRFYRVEKHHSQDAVKGTGLGLSIVKRAVEAHQGQITVSSTPGQHTTFTIQLPLAALADSPR